MSLSNIECRRASVRNGGFRSRAASRPLRTRSCCTRTNDRLRSLWPRSTLSCQLFDRDAPIAWKVVDQLRPRTYGQRRPVGYPHTGVTSPRVLLSFPAASWPLGRHIPRPGPCPSTRKVRRSRLLPWPGSLTSLCRRCRTLPTGTGPAYQTGTMCPMYLCASALYQVRLHC